MTKMFFVLIILAVFVYLITYQIGKTKDHNQLVEDIKDKKIFKHAKNAGVILVSDTETKVSCSGGKNSSCSVKNKPVIFYKYKIDGKEYTSDKIEPGDGPTFYKKIDAILFAKKYPIGKNIDIYYRIKNPSEAYLFCGKKKNFFSLGIMIPALFIISIVTMISFYNKK